MTLKKSLKYMIFTFLFMFLFVPNVNASTKYVLCEYETENAVTKIRVIFQNGSYLIGGGKASGNWNDISDNDLKKKFKNSENKYLKDIDGVSSCPTTIYRTASFSLSSSKIYTSDDMTCWYDAPTSGTAILPVPSTFYGIDNNTSISWKFLNEKTGSINNSDYQLNLKDYLALKTDKYANTWKNISKAWYYVEYLNEFGCPASFFRGNFAYKTIYFTNRENLTKKDLPSTWNSDNWEPYNLVCNKDWINAFSGSDGTSGRLSYLNDQALAKLKVYEKYDYDTWNNLYKSCQQDSKCSCKKEKTLSSYVSCRLANLSNEEYEKIEKEASNNSKEASKYGCSKEYANLKDKILNEGNTQRQNFINELTKKLNDQGIINEEDTKKVTETVNNNKKKAEEWITDLLTPNRSKLDELTENNERNCEDIFGKPCDKDNLSVLCLIQRIFDILKFLVPCLLIVLGSIDFSKVVISNDKEAMSKAVSTFVKRVIMAIAIFFLPTLVSLLINIFNSSYTTEEKIDCVIDALKGD